MDILEFMDSIECLAIRSNMYIAIRRGPLGCGWSVVTHAKEKHHPMLHILDTTLPSLRKVDDFEPFYNKIEKEVMHVSPIHMED